MTKRPDGEVDKRTVRPGSHARCVSAPPCSTEQRRRSNEAADDTVPTDSKCCTAKHHQSVNTDIEITHYCRCTLYKIQVTVPKLSTTFTNNNFVLANVSTERQCF